MISKDDTSIAHALGAATTANSPESWPKQCIAPRILLKKCNADILSVLCAADKIRLYFYWYEIML